MYEEMLFSDQEIALWERRYKVSNYIEQWRKPRYGELSIVETAQVAGVTLKIERGRRSEATLLTPLSLDHNHNYPLIINPLTNLDYRPLAFGHELGHLIMHLGGEHLPQNEEVYEAQERFCEHFGRELLLRGHGYLPYAPGQTVLFDHYDYADWSEL